MALEDNFLRLDFAEVDAENEAELERLYDEEFWRDMLKKYERKEL